MHSIICDREEKERGEVKSESTNVERRDIEEGNVKRVEKARGRGGGGTSFKALL